MEDIAATVKLALGIQYAIESGQSVRMGCEEFLKCAKSRDDEKLAKLLAVYLHFYDRGLPVEDILEQIDLPTQQAALRLIDKGLSGDSIYAPLTLFKNELLEKSEHEIEVFLANLPLKMMLPLVFFLFPAFMILLLGPTLMSLVTGLS